MFAVLVFIGLTFQQYGISNDEEVQHIYGRLLLDFYSSGGVDQSAFHYKNLYLYGGLFDLIAAVLEKFVPLWVWDMRHLLSALFGLLGMLAAYRIARHLGGERSGLLVLVLLCLTGAWSGAMFTHTKDVPFATCMTWALYYTILISERLPRPDLALCLKLGVAIGAALGLRIGGVFAVLYLGALVLLAALLQVPDWRQRLRFCAISAWRLLPAGLMVFVVMAVCWPWGVMSPSHPLEAAHAFSHFAFNMRTIVDGEVVSIGSVPRTYLLEYLLVRLPEIVLAGVAVLLGLALGRWRRLLRPADWSLPWSCLLLATLFPLAFVLWDDPALYNGVRHFTFVIPPLAILAALGLDACWQALHGSPYLRRGLVAACLAMASLSAVTLARLHPYEYIYYNQFAGNLAQAEREWEGDYWSSSLRAASDLLEREVEQDRGHKGPYLVAICAESIQGAAYLDKRFKVTKDWVAADFYISSTNMHCDHVLQGTIIGSIKRLGATLAVIKDRRKLTGKARLPQAAR